MKQLKIALTALAAESGISQENWKTVPLKGADLTDLFLAAYALWQLRRFARQGG